MYIILHNGTFLYGMGQKTFSLEDSYILCGCKVTFSILAGNGLQKWFFHLRLPVLPCWLETAYGYSFIICNFLFLAVGFMRPFGALKPYARN